MLIFHMYCICLYIGICLCACVCLFKFELVHINGDLYRCMFGLISFNLYNAYFLRIYCTSIFMHTCINDNELMYSSISTHNIPKRLITKGFPVVIFWYYSYMKHTFKIILHFGLCYLMQFPYSPAFVNSVAMFSIQFFCHYQNSTYPFSTLTYFKGPDAD